MKTNSPLRQDFLFFERTPSKIIVDCDINSWVETHLKKRRASQPQPIRIRKPIVITTTLASLRQEKRNMLNAENSTLGKASLQSTAQGSVSNRLSAERSSDLGKQGKPEPQEVTVSEFNCINVEKLKVRSRRLMSLNKIQKKQGLPLFDLLHVKLGSNHYRGMNFKSRKL